MAHAVVLPKMGMTMVEGTITEWFVADGDTVHEGDQLFSFETEKVDYEVTAEAAGSIRIMQPVDSIVEAGGLVAYILSEGESIQNAYRITLRIAGTGVIFTGIALAVGVGTWIFAPLKFQADMGILLTFMFLVNMLGAILLLPALASVLLRGKAPSS